MRLLHTSDWHLGRTFHGHPTTDALRTVLDALIAQVREHRVDAVLVSGDIFDHAAPAADLYRVLSDVFREIRAAGAHIVAISGNHDSATRLGFQAEWAALAGVHVRTDPRRMREPVTLHDEHGPVHLIGLPYLEPLLVRDL
ncbi:metallophosphoesterase family protein, partial [Leucobacter sp. M11]|uniref:metallophosphoesterase family protein n=1 Tax=Leucobacter sp. M11 TaxID=2993565 RepID=UPI002D7EACC1